jgi:hypothetical protein
MKILNKLFLNKVEIILKALSISSIIFLWSNQITIGHTRVALIYILFLFVVIFFKTRFQDIIIFAILTILFYLFLVIQIVPFNLNLITPIKTVIYIPIVLFLLVFCFRYITDIFRYGEEEKIFFFLRLLLKFQLSSQILELLLFHFGIKYHITSGMYIKDNLPRASGFFYEPSNVAFSLSPFIYILIQDYKKFIKFFKSDSIIILITIFLISFSTTFAVVIFISFLLKIIKIYKSKNFKKIIVSIGIMIFFIYLALTNNQISIRANQVLFRFAGTEVLSNNINASSAVFIKGFEMSKKALTSYPFGVGLDNMAFLNKFAKINKIKKNISQFNNDNGGSIMFKIIGEYGYIGLVIVIYTFLFLIKASLKTENINSYDIFINSQVLGLMSTFIRGPSYTVGVAIIGLSILFWTFIKYFNNNLKIVLYDKK